METIEMRKEPKEVALELAGQNLETESLLAATKYEVSLSNDGGYFRIHWKVDGPTGSYDWAGLYVNKDVPDSDYIGGNNWQWAQYGNSYKTSTPVQIGYQARYLVWNAKTGKYESVAWSQPWS